MFERYLASHLSSFLGEYFEEDCFSKEKLTIGAWDGSIVLKDLKLKSNVLDILDLPLTMKHGTIGTLKIEVPWSKLGAQPLTVIADKILILIVPKYDWNNEEKEAQAKAVKTARLAFADLIGTGSVSEDDDEEDELDEEGKPKKKSKGIEISAVAQALLERLLSRFIDSVHLHIQNVHVRYEDSLSCMSRPFATGLTFESLLAESVVPRKSQQSITSVISNRMGSLPRHLFYFSENEPPPNNLRRNQKNNTNNGRNKRQGNFEELEGDGVYIPPVCKLLEITQFAVYWNDIVTSSSTSTQHQGTLSERELKRFDFRDIQDAMFKLITKKTANGSSKSIKTHSLLSSMQSASFRSKQETSPKAKTNNEKASTNGCVQYVVSPFAINIWLTIPRNEDMILLEKGPQSASTSNKHQHPPSMTPSVHPSSSAANSDVSDVIAVSSSQPAVTMDIEASHVAVEFLDTQWIQLLSVMVGFASAGQSTAYVRSRPNTSPLRSAKLWWKYAYSVVIEEVVRANKCYSWSFLMARRKLRMEYVKLWKHKINKSLSKGDKWRLTLLENDLDVDTILVFRSMAARQVKAERRLDKLKRRRMQAAAEAGVKLSYAQSPKMKAILPSNKDKSSFSPPPNLKLNHHEKEAPETSLSGWSKYKKKTASWISWLSGVEEEEESSPTKSVEGEHASTAEWGEFEEEEANGFAEEERENLWTLLDWDPRQAAAAIDATASAALAEEDEEQERARIAKDKKVVLMMSIAMSSGSITIGNAYSSTRKKSNVHNQLNLLDERFNNFQPLVEIKWFSFLSDFKLFGDDGFDSALSLGDFGVSAFNAKSPQPYNLVTTKKANEDSPVFQLIGQYVGRSHDIRPSTEYVLRLHGENIALHAPTPVLKQGSSRDLHLCVDWVYDLMEWGQGDALDLMNDWQTLWFTKLHGMRAALLYGYDYVDYLFSSGSGSSRYLLDVDLEAPLLIVPETPRGILGPHLLIDCGCLRMRTDKLPKKDQYKKQYKAAAESKKKKDTITSSSSVRSSSSYNRSDRNTPTSPLSRHNSMPMSEFAQTFPAPQGRSQSRGVMSSSFNLKEGAPRTAASVRSDLSGGLGSVSSMFESSINFSRKTVDAQRKAEECYAKYTFSLTNSFAKFIDTSEGVPTAPPFNDEQQVNYDRLRTANHHVLMCPLNLVFNLDNFVNVSTKVNKSLYPELRVSGTCGDVSLTLSKSNCRRLLTVFTVGMRTAAVYNLFNDAIPETVVEKESSIFTGSSLSKPKESSNHGQDGRLSISGVVSLKSMSSAASFPYLNPSSPQLSPLKDGTVNTKLVPLDGDDEKEDEDSFHSLEDEVEPSDMQELIAEYVKDISHLKDKRDELKSLLEVVKGGKVVPDWLRNFFDEHGSSDTGSLVVDSALLFEECHQHKSLAYLIQVDLSGEMEDNDQDDDQDDRLVSYFSKGKHNLSEEWWLSVLTHTLSNLDFMGSISWVDINHLFYSKQKCVELLSKELILFEEELTELKQCLDDMLDAMKQALGASDTNGESSHVKSESNEDVEDDHFEDFNVELEAYESSLFETPDWLAASQEMLSNWKLKKQNRSNSFTDKQKQETDSSTNQVNNGPPPTPVRIHQGSKAVRKAYSEVPSKELLSFKFNVSKVCAIVSDEDDDDVQRAAEKRSASVYFDISNIGMFIQMGKVGITAGMSVENVLLCDEVRSTRNCKNHANDSDRDEIDFDTITSRRYLFSSSSCQNYDEFAATNSKEEKNILNETLSQSSLESELQLFPPFFVISYHSIVGDMPSNLQPQIENITLSSSVVSTSIMTHSSDDRKNKLYMLGHALHVGLGECDLNVDLIQLDRVLVFSAGLFEEFKPFYDTFSEIISGKETKEVTEIRDMDGMEVKENSDFKHEEPAKEGYASNLITPVNTPTKSALSSGLLTFCELFEVSIPPIEISVGWDKMKIVFKNDQVDQFSVAMLAGNASLNVSSKSEVVDVSMSIGDLVLEDSTSTSRALRRIFCKHVANQNDTAQQNTDDVNSFCSGMSDRKERNDTMTSLNKPLVCVNLSLSMQNIKRSLHADVWIRDDAKNAESSTRASNTTSSTDTSLDKVVDVDVLCELASPRLVMSCAFIGKLANYGITMTDFVLSRLPSDLLKPKDRVDGQRERNFQEEGKEVDASTCEKTPIEMQHQESNIAVDTSEAMCRALGFSFNFSAQVADSCLMLPADMVSDECIELTIGSVYMNTTVSPFIHHHHHEKQLDLITHVEVGFKNLHVAACAKQMNENLKSSDPIKRLPFVIAESINASIEIPLLPLKDVIGLEASLVDEVVSCMIEAPNKTNKLRVDPTNAEVKLDVGRNTISVASLVFVTFGDILTYNVTAFDRVFDYNALEKTLDLLKSKTSSQIIPPPPPAAAAATDTSDGAFEDESILFSVNSTVDSIPMQVKLMVSVDEVGLKLVDTDNSLGVIGLKVNGMKLSSTIGSSLCSSHVNKAKPINHVKSTPTILSVDGSLLSVELSDLRRTPSETISISEVDRVITKSQVVNCFDKRNKPSFRQHAISKEDDEESSMPFLYDPSKLIESHHAQDSSVSSGHLLSSSSILEPFLQFNLSVAYDTRSGLEEVNTRGVTASPFRVSFDVFSNSIDVRLSPDPIIAAVNTGLDLLPSVELLQNSINKCVDVVMCCPLMASSNIPTANTSTVPNTVNGTPRDPLLQVGLCVPYLLGGFVSLIVVSSHTKPFKAWFLEDIQDVDSDRLGGRFGDGFCFTLGHTTSRISLDLVTLTTAPEPCSLSPEDRTLSKYGDRGNNVRDVHWSFSASTLAPALSLELTLDNIEFQYVRCLNPFLLHVSQLDTLSSKDIRVKNMELVLVCESIVLPLSINMQHLCFALSLPQSESQNRNTTNQTGIKLLKLSQDVSISISLVTTKISALTLSDIEKLVKRVSMLSLQKGDVFPVHENPESHSGNSGSKEAAAVFHYGRSVIFPMVIDSEIAALICMSEADVKVELKGAQAHVLIGDFDQYKELIRLDMMNLTFAMKLRHEDRLNCLLLEQYHESAPSILKMASIRNTTQMLIGSNPGTLSMSMAMKLSVYYKNYVISCWEPLVEPLAAEFDTLLFLSDLIALSPTAITACAVSQQGEVDTNPTSKVQRVDSLPTSETVHTSTLAMKMNLKNKLEVNVTEAMLESISRINVPSLKVIAIHNDTGATCWYQSCFGPIMIASGSQVNIPNVGDFSMPLPIAIEVPKSLGGNGLELVEILLKDSEAQIHRINVSSKSNESESMSSIDGYDLVCDVTYLQEADPSSSINHKITLRSTVVFDNRSGLDLVAVLSQSSAAETVNSSSNTQTGFVIESGKTSSFPVFACAHSISRQLSVTPLSDEDQQASSNSTDIRDDGQHGNAALMSRNDHSLLFKPVIITLGVSDSSYLECDTLQENRTNKCFLYLENKVFSFHNSVDDTSLPTYQYHMLSFFSPIKITNHLLLPIDIELEAFSLIDSYSSKQSFRYKIDSGEDLFCHEFSNTQEVSMRMRTRSGRIKSNWSVFSVLDNESDFKQVEKNGSSKSIVLEQLNSQGELVSVNMQVATEVSPATRHIKLFSQCWFVNTTHLSISLDKQRKFHFSSPVPVSASDVAQTASYTQPRGLLDIVSSDDARKQSNEDTQNLSSKNTVTSFTDLLTSQFKYSEGGVQFGDYQPTLIGQNTSLDNSEIKSNLLKDFGVVVSNIVCPFDENVTVFVLSYACHITNATFYDFELSSIRESDTDNHSSLNINSGSMKSFHCGKSEAVKLRIINEAGWLWSEEILLTCNYSDVTTKQVELMGVNGVDTSGSKIVKVLNPISNLISLLDVSLVCENTFYFLVISKVEEISGKSEDEVPNSASTLYNEKNEITKVPNIGSSETPYSFEKSLQFPKSSKGLERCRRRLELPFQFSLHIQGFGLCLIEHRFTNHINNQSFQPRELLYFTMNDINVDIQVMANPLPRFESNELVGYQLTSFQELKVKFHVDHLQVDNQLVESRFPNIVMMKRGQPLLERNSFAASDQKSSGAVLSECVVDLSSLDVFTLRRLSIGLVPFEVSVDSLLLAASLNLVMRLVQLMVHNDLVDSLLEPTKTGEIYDAPLRRGSFVDDKNRKSTALSKKRTGSLLKENQRRCQVALYLSNLSKARSLIQGDIVTSQITSSSVAQDEVIIEVLEVSKLEIEFSFNLDTGEEVSTDNKSGTRVKVDDLIRTLAHIISQLFQGLAISKEPLTAKALSQLLTSTPVSVVPQNSSARNAYGIFSLLQHKFLAVMFQSSAIVLSSVVQRVPVVLNAVTTTQVRGDMNTVAMSIIDCYMKQATRSMSHLVSSVAVKRPLQSTNRLLLYRFGLAIYPVLDFVDTSARQLRLAFRQGIRRSIRNSFPNGIVRDVFKLPGLSMLAGSSSESLLLDTPLFSVNRMGQNVVLSRTSTYERELSGVMSPLPLWVHGLKLKAKNWTDLEASTPKVRDKDPRSFTSFDRIKSNFQYQVNELIAAECKWGEVNKLELRGGALICTEVELMVVTCVGVQGAEQANNDAGRLHITLRITVRQVQSVELLEQGNILSLRINFINWLKGSDEIESQICHLPRNSTKVMAEEFLRTVLERIQAVQSISMGPEPTK